MFLLFLLHPNFVLFLMILVNSFPLNAFVFCFLGGLNSFAPDLVVTFRDILGERILTEQLTFFTCLTFDFWRNVGRSLKIALSFKMEALNDVLPVFVDIIATEEMHS